MVKKPYDWSGGAVLDEHSKTKHKILSEYFRQYLITRCQLPQQEKFRLAVVDGFSGAGKYKCGSFGSPLIFIETLKNAIEEINLSRVNQNIRPIEIECLLIFNDLEKGTIDQLEKNIAPFYAEIKENNKKLHLKIKYFNQKFADAYSKIKGILQSKKYKSVLFNLDQCGYSGVDSIGIKDIMNSWTSAEIFLTFPIKAILAFISPDKINNNALPIADDVLREIYALVESSDQAISKGAWLGRVEKIIFDSLRSCGACVSPFSINNPEGWRYWLMHFANKYRARQVYNDILHSNSSTQAHFGRSGLNMLSYDPDHEGTLCLFDDKSREMDRKELYDDIPRLIQQHGDALSVEDFYMEIYNGTASHSDDIHKMIMENPDVEVITASGRERRKSNTIKRIDTLKLKNQKTFFSMFDSMPRVRTY